MITLLLKKSMKTGTGLHLGSLSHCARRQRSQEVGSSRLIQNYVGRPLIPLSPSPPLRSIKLPDPRDCYDYKWITNGDGGRDSGARPDQSRHEKRRRIRTAEKRQSGQTNTKETRPYYLGPYTQERQESMKDLNNASKSAAYLAYSFRRSLEACTRKR
ncbi:hypothetical protein TNCV_1351611 [Trichonephila clavipes]|nr:hypothetical protein TNCV_1351611 [Trichonephila clavipes]